MNCLQHFKYILCTQLETLKIIKWMNVVKISTFRTLHSQPFQQLPNNFVLNTNDNLIFILSNRACEDTEVDLIADELVVVLEKTGTGWWYVQAKSGTGWAPNHFLKVPTGLMDENSKVSFW